MSDAIKKDLSHHQYIRARWEKAFPDADEETLADTLESLSNLPGMLVRGGDLNK